MRSGPNRLELRLGLLVIGGMVAAVLLYAPGIGVRSHDLCPLPVKVQDRIVACDGRLPGPATAPSGRAA